MVVQKETRVLAGPVEEVEYNIIGKILESGPWQHHQELNHQVTYIPKDWLSIPVKLWVPNIHWNVFWVVVVIQSFLTFVVF